MSYHDWMPGKRADQLLMAKTWLTEFGVSTGAWTITQAEISDLRDLVEVAEFNMERLAANPGSRVFAAKTREAFNELKRTMRLMHRRKFFSPPMQDSDWIRLDLRPPDLIRTPHIEVNEVVEFELVLREIREILVHFWIKGVSHKAKPAGYDGAVLIWDILDAPPAEPGNLNRHTMASRTPHAIEFTEEERGKTVYIALAWQNERGIIGAWSVIQSAIVP